jgi:hypothetical protein
MKCTNSPANIHGATTASENLKIYIFTYLGYVTIDGVWIGEWIY